MKILVALLAFSSASAAPLKCANGGSPRLTGDLFAPVDCSSATLPVAALPVPPAKPRKLRLKGLDGAYEGSAVQGMGRYEIRVELKTGWFGRAEAALKLLELQFHSLTASRLTLSPAKGPGRFDAVLASDDLPGAELKGEAQAGAIEASTAAARGAINDGSQVDLLFSNGARYRVRLAPSGSAGYRAQVWWAVPGAPARSFETQLTRAAAQP
ncbi:MAG TPA: hypothetical protein VN915_08015 [Elusimicrobiota bacterium]|nr:hypothetical protein [Elusimicrobiota bacterium]